MQERKPEMTDAGTKPMMAETWTRMVDGAEEEMYREMCEDEEE